MDVGLRKHGRDHRVIFPATGAVPLPTRRRRPALATDTAVAGTFGGSR